MYAVLYVLDEKSFFANENTGWLLWGVYSTQEQAQRSLEVCWKNPDVKQVRMVTHYEDER